MADASELLARFPAFAGADNRSRELDAIEIELSDRTPLAACMAIEAKWRGRQISRDDALSLLWMHTERVVALIAEIETRITREER